MVVSLGVEITEVARRESLEAYELIDAWRLACLIEEYVSVH